ncbi:MAG: hypothetical protein EZS28_038283, partial [Streblomastix strix]
PFQFNHETVRFSEIELEIELDGEQEIECSGDVEIECSGVMDLE